jgi:hypothetical protein
MYVDKIVHSNHGKKLIHVQLIHQLQLGKRMIQDRFFAVFQLPLFAISCTKPLLRIKSQVLFVYAFLCLCLQRCLYKSDIVFVDAKIC